MADKTVVVRLVADTSAYRAGLAQAAGSTKALASSTSSSVKQVGGSVAALGGSASKLLAPAALLGGVIAIKKASDAFMDTGKEVLKLKRYMGGTAEEASRMRFAAQQTGMDVDAFGRALGIASKKLVESKNTMADFGVQTRDSAGQMLPMEQILLSVADRFQRMEAGPTKVAAAMDLFGRAGANMIPFLDRGRDGIDALMQKAEEFGLVLSEDNLNAVKANLAAQREFDAAMQGLGVSLGSVVTPAITGVTRALTAVPSAMTAAGAGVAALAGGAFVLNKSWTAMSGVVGKTSAYMKAQAAASGTAAAMGSMALTGAAAAAAVVGLVVALNEYQSMTEANDAEAKKVMGRVHEKVMDEATSFEYLNDMLRRSNEERQKLTGEFNRPMRDAMHAEEQIQAKLIDRAIDLSRERGISTDEALNAARAEHRLDEERKKAPPTAEEAAAAEQQLAANRRAMTDGVFGLVDAEKGYRDALRGVSDAQKAAGDADRKVTDARQAAVDSVRKIGDAQRSYQDALRNVGAAEERRVDSLRKIEDAQKAVTDAQVKLDEAMRGPGEDDQISLERAKIRLEQAKRSLAGGDFETSLDRNSAKLDVRQAEADLARLEQEIASRVPEAQANLADAQQQLVDADRDARDAALGVADAQRGVADAARGVRDAQRDAADATRAIRDAELESIDAHQAVIDKQGEVAGAAYTLWKQKADLQDLFLNDPAAIGPAIDSLNELKKLYPEVAASIQPYLDKLNELAYAPRPEDIANAGTNNPPPVSLRDRVSHELPPIKPFTGQGETARIGDPFPREVNPKNYPRRAAGGRVLKGRPYLVGERGPEPFVPDQNGTIVPHSQYAGTMHPPGVQTPGVSITHTYYGTTGEQAATIARRRDARELTGRQGR